VDALSVGAAGPTRAQKDRPRLLFVQRKLGTLGGSAAVAAWMLQALVRDYDVTLLCWRPPELDAMNRFFGTSVKAGDLKIVPVPALLRHIVELDPDPGSIQDWCILLRRCKYRRYNYDLVLSTELEADYGVPGIQYIHWPGITSFYPPAVSLSELPWWRRPAALIRGELRPWMLMADFSFERMRQNVTLTSSEWVGEFVRRAYGIETETLYPPACGSFSNQPWAQREDGFVCVGRMNPEKRIEWIIETLGHVRERRPNLKLHVAASLDIASGARDYRRRISALAQSNADWIHLHEDLSREELLELLARNRYGIHANTREHFGIAVAEMLLAGSIPFVPSKGGPVEIVGRQPGLIYSSMEDAVEKILAMMSDRARQEASLAALAQRAELFTTERFMRDIRALVARELRLRDNNSRIVTSV
jgi:glycosyltransferase involved in cell wall biosynthesis